VYFLEYNISKDPRVIYMCLYEGLSITTSVQTQERITIMKRYTVRENYLLQAIRYMLFNKNRDAGN